MSSERPGVEPAQGSLAGPSFESSEPTLAGRTPVPLATRHFPEPPRPRADETPLFRIPRPDVLNKGHRDEVLDILITRGEREFQELEAPVDEIAITALVGLDDEACEIAKQHTL